ncbi:MAG: mucoidy inhibitor MuiA family protein [Omnitrophica WOR_2 bacterium]
MPQLQTTITAVTVYPDRARVTRSGTIGQEPDPLQPGAYPVEVLNLPVQINPDSVRVSAHGTARARLSGLQVQRSSFSETPEDQVRSLEEQIEALGDELQSLEAKTERLKESRLNLVSLAGQTETYATALASGEMSVEAQLGIFAGLRSQAEKLDAEILELAARRRSLERRLQKLRRELDQLNSARPRQRYIAQIEVEVLQAGSLTFDLSYTVSGAGWKPLYDIRLVEIGSSESGGPELEISYLGQVTQQTGEAWENTSLSLSTARPALASRLPELDPWYIQPYQPPPPPLPVRPAMEPMMMRVVKQSAAADSEEALGPVPEQEAEHSLAGVDASGAAITYLAPGKTSIPSDGAPHKVNVARFNLQPELDYVSAPRLVQAAYRRAKVTNQSPYIFLPGQVNLFAGDEFIGSTSIELTAPLGEIELYLGVDDRVKVERELKRREVDKRFIGGKRRIQYGYEIKLENLLPVPATVVLHDQIPVGRHEDIRVRLESCEPKPTEQTQLNLLTWEFELAPQEKRTVSYEFSVEHPQVMEVIGLP